MNTPDCALVFARLIAVIVTAFLTWLVAMTVKLALVITLMNAGAVSLALVMTHFPAILVTFLIALAVEFALLLAPVLVMVMLMPIFVIESDPPSGVVTVEL